MLLGTSNLNGDSDCTCIGEWHVGYKRAFDLFPKGLQKRIAGERKKRLDEQQRGYMTAAVQQHAARSKALAQQVKSLCVTLAAQSQG